MKKAKKSEVSVVIQRMLSILDKSGYRFLAGVAAAFEDGSRPALLVVEKDGQWHVLEADVEGYKPSDAKRLIQLMLEPCPCTVAEIVSSVEEFAGKYRGRTTWITNAI